MTMASLGSEEHAAALDDCAPSEDVIRRLGTAGKLSPGTEIRIVDSDQNEVGVGVVGMIHARCSCMFTGYLNNPEKTAETLLEDGFVVTGDYGYLDEEGYLHIEGRGAETIVLATGGNVYPHELEDAVASMDGLVECGVGKVRVRLSKTSGSVDEVGAYVVVKDGTVLDVAKVEDVVRSKIAHKWRDMADAAKLSPSSKPLHVFFTDEPLPRNKNGKVMKERLMRRVGYSSVAA